MRVILKSYKESKHKSETMLIEFGKTLEQKGWTCSIVESGYVSPDNSTIFIFGRSPYYGQLLQYTKDMDSEFETCANGLIASGEFVKI